MRGHGKPTATIKSREEGTRAKAIEAGLLVLKEIGEASPRFKENFLAGKFAVDPNLDAVVSDILLATTWQQPCWPCDSFCWTLCFTWFVVS